MNKVELTMREWELIRDAFADVACWHHGFGAANKDYTPPPQLWQVVSMLADIKNRINRHQRETDEKTATKF